MSEMVRRLICILGFLLFLGTPLLAQENLDFGKTPAKLFASDCASCHKSPQGLAAKGGGILGLEGFLREHYTASRETAASIAGYLRAAGNAPAASGRAGKGKGKKGDDKAKGAEKKSDAPKPSEAKASEAKPAEPKPAKPKAAKPKPAESGKSD